MTKDIDPTPRQGNQYSPSSAALDIARLKERHNALKDDFGEMRSMVVDIKGLLLNHITSAQERHSQLLATFNQHNLEDAVVHHRVLQIDRHLEATDARLEESNKRDPVTFWTSVSAGVVALCAIATAIWGNKP